MRRTRTLHSGNQPSDLRWERSSPSQPAELGASNALLLQGTEFCASLFTAELWQQPAYGSICIRHSVSDGLLGPHLCGPPSLSRSPKLPMDVLVASPEVAAWYGIKATQVVGSPAWVPSLHLNLAGPFRTHLTVSSLMSV